MDIFAHALWTNVVYYKNYKNNLKDRLWAVFFGIMPDLISFVPATLYAFFHSGKDNFVNMSNSQLWVFTWARESYNITHSLVTLALVIAVVLAIRKGKMYWPLLGWGLHIGIDIFTHPSFYQTPFLYPLSGFKNNYAISWSEPVFMLVNYTAIAVLYILIFTVWRRKKQFR